MTSFNHEDVISVAKAMLENHSYFNSGDYSRDYYNCMHCNGISKDWATNKNQIKHDFSCPVLMAQDLLTGSQ